MLWPSLFLSLSRSWGTVPETGADHNWHLHCPSSSWHHVCGGLLQNQVNFSLLFYIYGCWSGPSQLTVASNPLSVTLYMGVSRGELKRQTCGQGALVPIRGVQVSMSLSNAKIRQVSKTGIWKVSHPSNVTWANFTDLQFLQFFVCHPFQLVSPTGKEQTPTPESCCSAAVNFMYQPSLFVLEARLMVLKVTKHQRPKKRMWKCSQCKSRHLNAFYESL